MHKKYVKLNDRLYGYLLEQMTPPDEILRDLAEETAKLGPVSGMQIAHEQGAFLTMLCRLMNAKHAIEIGTFTGYSTICIARGLSENGSLITCDKSHEWTKIARRYVERAGLTERIRFRTGDALTSIADLPFRTTFDLAFIDADKSRYMLYYLQIFPHMRPNGVFIFDNTLWDGAVANPKATDPDTTALQNLNKYLASDERIEVVLLPIADGLTLARRR